MATASVPRSWERRSTLCVDLDGTLFPGDLLWESIIRLVKRRPLSLLMLPVWLLRGRAHFKREIAKRVTFDPRSLPYREDVLAFLSASKARGTDLVLATGADERQARAVAAHLGMFSDVVASDGSRNLSGHRKAHFLAARFGANQFDYLGNDWVDLPIWTAAGRAMVAGAPRRLLSHLSGRLDIVKVLSPSGGRLRPMVRALRPYQWVKNLLVLVPLITSHQILSPSLLGRSLVTMLAFCLCASAIYIVNDLLDIESDRLHPRKKRRPFAAGELGVPTGIAMSIGLFATSLAGAWLGVSLATAGIIALYAAATSAYSFRLKREPVADVFLLALLYVVRIFAGGVATGIVISTWLLAFAMFFFLSLAFVKRYSELSTHGGTMPGRGYQANDSLWMHAIGTSSGYMAVLVLALYVKSPEVVGLYGRPSVLWLLCPLLLYWITVTWFRAGRGTSVDDPVLEAVRDPMSYVSGLLGAVILISAL
jgi:4-hydroxybenzoate polyprenyltransferase/phosphoserine phosphatase